MPGDFMRLPQPSEKPYGMSFVKEVKSITSEERHELRYQRRKLKRLQAKKEKYGNADDFDKVFTYENLYNAYKKCRRNVAWKASVQKYIAQAPLNVYNTMEKLKSGKYKSPAFFEFDIFERGKKRHIRSTIIGERVVQRCLCDNSLVPILGSTFIHDNGACMKNKGYDFAVDRLNCHLQKYIRKNSTEGYIAICDLKSFFDSIEHWAISKLLHKRFTDLQLIGITEDMIRQFDPHKPMCERKGLGLGSQVSQLLAPAIAGYIDHFVKEKLRVKYYGRYMDDFYLIHKDKQYLERCLSAISEECERLGLTLSKRKTHIVKLTHPFTFLKVRYYITPTGKIIRKIHPSSITRQRRRLKKLHKRFTQGLMTFIDCYNSFQSWRSHAERFNAYRTIKNMERLFNELFIEGGSQKCSTLRL